MKLAFTALLIACVVIMPARAQVTYSYTGNPYTAIFDYSGNYKLSGFVTAALTVSDPLPQTPNTSIDATTLPGFSLTMTDGSQVLTASIEHTHATFTFDGNGDVKDWFVSVGGWTGITSKSDGIFALDQGVRVRANRLTMAQSRNPSSWVGFRIRHSEVSSQTPILSELVPSPR